MADSAPGTGTEEDDVFVPAGSSSRFELPPPTGANSSRLSYRPSQLRRVLSLCFVGDIPNKNTLRSELLQKYPELLFHESVDGSEPHFNVNSDLAFVLADFESALFEHMQKKARIFSPVALTECAATAEDLVVPRRPIYCWSMKGVICAITGIRSKPIRRRLVHCIHYMGGTCRDTVTANITHLISRTTQSENYRVAVSLGKPVMSDTWIEECWSKRDTLFYSALNDHNISRNKLLPFYDLKIAFEGFSVPELLEFETLTPQYGGRVVEADDTEMTHLVVNYAIDKTKPKAADDAKWIVTGEWYWVSIQLDLCASERLYDACDRRRQELEPASRHVVADSNGDEPHTAHNNIPLHQIVDTPSKPPRRSHQLKRLQGATKSSNNIEPVQEHNTSAEYNQDLSYAELFSRSADDLDQQLGGAEGPAAVKVSPSVDNSKQTKAMSKRHQVFKQKLEAHDRPLEDSHPEKMLLTKSERNQIFGKIQSIYDTHRMISANLYALVNHWNDQHKIGKVWCDASEELQKCYPPYVNTFEQTKQLLAECDKNKPKFHAFLKACEASSDCQRQTLRELLIRPVQRLPSVMLLLAELLKRTPKEHKDNAQVVKASEAIKAVLTHVNSCKRETENNVQLMLHFYQIDNLASDVFSAKRTLVSTLDALDVQGHFHSIKGQPITFFLYNDMLVVAKQRNRVRAQRLHHQQQQQQVSNAQPSTAATPATPGHKHDEHLKTHKYICKHDGVTLRSANDVINCPESTQIFLLKFRRANEDVLMPFLADSSDVHAKRRFLLQLRPMAIESRLAEDGGVAVFELIDTDASVLMEGPTFDEISKALKFLGRHSLNSSSLNVSMQSECSAAHRQSVTSSSSLATMTPSRMQRALSFSNRKQGGGLKRALSSMTVGVRASLSRVSATNLRMLANNMTHIREQDENESPAHGQGASASNLLNATHCTTNTLSTPQPQSSRVGYANDALAHGQYAHDQCPYD